MKLPGITSNLRGLMQCLVPVLYIIRQLAVLEKEKSLEPFNPTCNLEEKKYMCQWNLLSSLTALILKDANCGILACKILFSGIIN